MEPVQDLAYALPTPSPSFRRRPESSNPGKGLLRNASERAGCGDKPAHRYWIPACAGMTVRGS